MDECFSYFCHDYKCRTHSEGKVKRRFIHKGVTRWDIYIHIYSAGGRKWGPRLLGEGPKEGRSKLLFTHSVTHGNPHSNPVQIPSHSRLSTQCPHSVHREGKQAKFQGIYTQREVHVSKEQKYWCVQIYSATALFPLFS